MTGDGRPSADSLRAIFERDSSVFRDVLWLQPRQTYLA